MRLLIEKPTPDMVDKIHAHLFGQVAKLYGCGDNLYVKNGAIVCSKSCNLCHLNKIKKEYDQRQGKMLIAIMEHYLTELEEIKEHLERRKHLDKWMCNTIPLIAGSMLKKTA